MKHKHSHASGKRELRLNIAPQTFEIRKVSDGSRTISGYAAVFNSLSEDLGGFREKLQPGVFAKSLIDNPDVFAYYQHDSSKILGRVSSGTLKLAEDSTGLRFTLSVPNTSDGNDLVVLAERGDLSSMSFGFVCAQDEWADVDGVLIRTLIQVVLYEISVVGIPAYSESSFSLRSAPAAIRARLKHAKKRDDNEQDDPNDDNDDSDDDDSDDDPDADCGCDCDECEDGECRACSDPECEEEACADCPAQTRAAHLALIARRLR